MMEIFKKIESGALNPASELLKYAQKNDGVSIMHYGSLHNNPYPLILDDMKKYVSYKGGIVNSINKYEEERGLLELRIEICKMYKNSYGIEIDPHSEILITNGSVEALNLAILTTTNINEKVLITNPTYSMYSKVLESLNREYITFNREPNKRGEYKLIDNIKLSNIKSLIINSPENPTGYILSEKDWEEVSIIANKHNITIIHDEVFFGLDYYDLHKPAFAIKSIRKNSILVNGVSKTFGLSGLKIGWFISSKEIVDKALHFHNNLYLGVNPISEYIAYKILQNKEISEWLESIKLDLKNRSINMMNELGDKEGYTWTRFPYGGLNLTPNISKLYEMMPNKYRDNSLSRGSSVANYLLNRKKVTVTPGIVYGSELSDYVKISICGNLDDFTNGVHKLK